MHDAFVRIEEQAAGRRGRSRARPGVVAWLILLGAAATSAACGPAVRTIGYNASMPTALTKGVVYYLPSARIRLEVSETRDAQGTSAFQFKVLPTEYYPDTSLPLVLDYDPPAGADETFCVSRGPDGLLTKIEIDSADRTGDVIVKIAETVATAVLRVPSGRGARATPQAAPQRPRDPITLVFDPCGGQGHEADDARQRLEQWFGDGRKVTLKFPCGARGTAKDQCEAGSVCYRSKTKVLFAIDATAAPGVGAIHATLTADYPANEHVGVLDLKRTILTRTVNSIGFQDGMLTEFGISRASPLYEAARLPLRIINAVLDVPVSFFNKIAAGFRSEAAANQAAAELIKAQAELEKARKDPHAATTPPGGGGQTGSEIGTTLTTPPGFVSDKVCKGKS